MSLYYSVVDIGPCMAMPCQNNGTCVYNSSGGYECRCQPMTSGEHCEIGMREQHYKQRCQIINWQMASIGSIVVMVIITLYYHYHYHLTVQIRIAIIWLYFIGLFRLCSGTLCWWSLSEPRYLHRTSTGRGVCLSGQLLGLVLWKW